MRARLRGAPRISLMVLITLALIGGIGRAATRTSAATNGLVAAFSFDDGTGSTVNDASGSGNNGTAANTTWVTGHTGKALSFNGSSSRVTVPDAASLDLTTAMTLEAWVRRSGTITHWRDLIFKGDDNYYLSASSDPNNRPVGGGIIGGTYGEAYGTATLANNTWTYLALTYDGAAVRLYVNGSQVRSTAKTGTIATSTNPLTLGSDPIYGQYFSGQIDDVRVYNTALSAAQVQTDMNTPVGSTADTQAPSAPATLSATAFSSGRVDLSWAAATDNVAVTGYRIERCQGVGCSIFSQIAAPTGTGTTYSDTSALPSTTYTYRVRATDAGGNLGGYSPTATAATPGDTQAPGAPTTLSATTIIAQRIDLSWAGSTDNVGVTGYLIERCQGVGCGIFSQIAAPTGTGTTYSDTTVVAGTSYSYRVRATDAAGNFGGYSPTATAVTPGASMPTPVAAYSFDEPSGTTAFDGSGNGNNGTIASATRTMGKNGSALSFNGTSGRVTVPDAPALHLSTAMTLETWVNASSGNTHWRDLIYKGNDNYYLSGSSDPNNRPAGGALIGATYGEVYATAALATNTWTHLALTYDGSSERLYVNGAQVASLAKTGTIATSTNPLTIGSDPIYGQYFAGLIDDVRVYNVALTAAQIQTDMNTPVPGSGDSQPPTVSITSPSAGNVADVVNVAATAADNQVVASVQFYVDGLATGPEDLTAPYGFTWDTHLYSQGTHTLTARARDASGNTTLSPPVTVAVTNDGVFQLEKLATAFTIPTAFAFLPDGRMVVAEMGGTIRIMSPPYTQPDFTPLLTITNVAPLDQAGDVNGVMNVAVDPNFATNHYFYVDYTANSPYRTRLSRFTANATVTGTVPGSELILYQDTANAGADHHAGAIFFGNDGKIYFTTGDEVNTPADAQNLTSPRGKILRINPDGTVPIDNPFYDGSGPNYDAIWAYGLRNPFRGSYDSPTGRLFIGDVGGNVYSTANEHLDLGAARANYAWPNCEGNCSSPPYTNGIYNYSHADGRGGLRDACIVAGFVYHGTQFPSSYEGSFFVADYAQNWIKRLTFDASGTAVANVFPFEPPDGSVDGPYGAITDLKEGPDGALYYLDVGFDDQTPQVAAPSLRRIRYVRSNQPPTALAAADQTQGPPPFTVNFSSAGSADPEGRPLTYSWDFGDGTTSTAANPSHTYTAAGRYTVRLTTSDGTNSTVSSPITITAGTPPVPTILSPQDGATFRGGDVISYSGSGTDAEDGTLPASAFTWEIDLLHAGHVHPGLPSTGSSSGTFTIPVTGHDFSGNVRYRISLTVTDSDGISTKTSVIIWPQKVNLTFHTAPEGLTLLVNGLPSVTPFVHDELIGFNEVVEADDQTLGSTNYTFGSWSDGGARQHTIVVPSSDASYTANYNFTATPAFVQVASSVPQTPQTTVTTSLPSPQSLGDLNVVAIGWANTTSDVASVTDGAGNVYVRAAPTNRSSQDSQAIFYAKNILSGLNLVTVNMTASTPYVDVRVAEYSGLDLMNPLDVTAGAGGSSSSPSSGSATTTKAREILVGAGTTSGIFNGPGSGYTSRIVTQPDGDILEDRFVTTTGSYSATAASSNSSWVMQMAAFQVAGQ